MNTFSYLCWPPASFPHTHPCTRCALGVQHIAPPRHGQTPHKALFKIQIWATFLPLSVTQKHERYRRRIREQSNLFHLYCNKYKAFAEMCCISPEFTLQGQTAPQSPRTRLPGTGVRFSSLSITPIHGPDGNADEISHDLRRLEKLFSQISNPSKSGSADHSDRENRLMWPVRCVPDTRNEAEKNDLRISSSDTLTTRILITN